MQKKQGKTKFVYMKKIKNLLLMLFFILCFISLFVLLNKDINKYILILFMLPTLIFCIYKQLNKIFIFFFALTATIFGFLTFGLNILSFLILIIFVTAIFVLYRIFKPKEIIDPQLQYKNKELHFFKEELLNEELYLKTEKETLEKNLEKIVNFYMISKDLIQNFTDYQNAATALSNILEKQTGILYVVVISNEKSSNGIKELKILSKLSDEKKEKWLKVIKDNNEITNLKHPTLINSLFEIDNKPVIAWPIIINNTLAACAFLVIEKDFVQEYIEQGNLYIPHLQLGTERIMLFLETKEKSRTDALTGVYLRRYFLEKLNIEIKRAKRYKTNFHILMLDIDFFKKINDTYGHLTGDKVLIEISKKIEQNIRPTDILCRYGGEEFIVLLNNLTDTDALNVAQNIRNEIKKIKFNEDNIVFSVTVSIGITKYKESFNSKEIISVADKALYEAKNSGRDRVVSFITTK